VSNQKKHGGGPKTVEGKQRSSMNSLRHGFTGKTVVLPTEDPVQFEELIDDYTADFKPGTKVELDIVYELAVCRWRLQRLWNIESYAFELTMSRKRDEVDAEFPKCTDSLRTALAFMSMADGNNKSLALLLRYETRLTRRFTQLLKDLKALQSQRKAAEPAAEPAPAPNVYQTNSKGPTLVPPPPTKRREQLEDSPDLNGKPTVA